GERGGRDQQGQREGRGQGDDRDQQAGDRQGQREGQGRRDDRDRQGQREGQGERDDRDRQGRRDDRDRQGQGDGQGQREGQQRDLDDDGDDDGRRGRRRNRNRNRNRDRQRARPGAPGGGQGAAGQQDEEAYSDEDVLVPVGGVLDLLDNYAFIRTTGYLPGPTDVYVPMGLVKKHGLRKGDAVQGAIKAPQDGSDVGQHTVSATGNKRDRGKFSALVRLDSVNGRSPEEARRRPEFAKLTPL